MHIMSGGLIGVFVVLLMMVGVAVSVALLAPHKGGSGSVGSYKRRKLLTPNEGEFFNRLVSALPECYVFPQVSMIALLEASSSNSKVAYRDRLRIAQQRVDYVICNRKLAVVVVVELDDKTHSASKDKVRDKRLLQAGIRTVRFQSKEKPDVVALRAAILAEVVSTGQPEKKDPAPHLSVVGSSVQK